MGGNYQAAILAVIEAGQIPSESGERCEIAAALEPAEREAAKERQESGANQYSEPSEKFTQGSGKALDHVAAAIGVSRPTHSGPTTRNSVTTQQTRTALIDFREPTFS